MGVVEWRNAAIHRAHAHWNWRGNSK